MTIVAGRHLIEDRHDGIALGLLCRRSLAPHLDRDAPEILEVTRGCFDRYHDMFGIRYPFGKYDQAFVPELNLGAMENPGCVTFRDEFIFRSAVTDADREQRAVVIAHEMAHMWFGNLVTLRWWDDIWLNESFAEHMGWRLPPGSTRFTGAWTSLLLRKASGYSADQRPSPIRSPPRRCRHRPGHAELRRGISYARRASVLRQLSRGWATRCSWRVCGRTSPATPTATPPSPTCSRPDRGQRRDLHHWAECGYAGQGQHAARRGHAGARRALSGGGGRPDPSPAIRRCDRTASTWGCTADPDRPYSCRAAEVDLDPTVDGGRTRVADLVGTRPGRLLLVNDGDLTFAKVRLDAASRAELIHILPTLEDSPPCPGLGRRRRRHA
jgi:aminopeptidase N